MNAKEYKKLFERINNLPTFWRGVSIIKENCARTWELKAFVWMDNGYGGGLSTVKVESESLTDGMQQILNKIDEHTKMFGHRFM